MDALRVELRLPGGYEFHFAKNPWKVREALLAAVLPFEFRYHLFVLDKAAAIREGRSLPSPDALYLEMAGLLFEQARPYLREAALLIDKGGSRELRGSLLRRLRGDAGSGEGQRVIKGVRQQDSHRNNLLQLADYVASCNNHAISGKRVAGELLERYLRRKEVTRGVWP